MAACGLAYLTSFEGVFLLDDQQNIVENKSIRRFWPPTGWLTGTRRPVVNLTLAFNYAVSHLEVWSYHALNLTVHVLAALTLYGVVRRTMGFLHGRGGGDRASPWTAGLAALIWAVHPLQSQSVTYVIQRGESMMGLFLLLALYCLIRGVESGRARWWHAGAVAACALGMGSKAVMIAAPAVLLLYDRTFLAGSFRETLRRRWPLHAALFATIALLIPLGVVGAVLDPSRSKVTVGLGYTGATPWQYALTQPGVILHYLKLALWPCSLCLDYGWPFAASAREAVLPAVIVAALMAASVWALVRRSWAGFAGAWFFLILAPTSSVIPIKDAAFEHRMYLPLAAVVLLPIGASRRALAALTPNRLGLAKTLGGTAAIALVLLLTAGTARRNRTYHSLVTMWSDVVSKRPLHARARSNLGVVLFDSGRVPEAFAEQVEALRLMPDEPGIRVNMGVTLLSVGRVDEAIDHLTEALKRDPGHVLAHYNLGNALLAQGRRDEAIAHYRQALRLQPANAPALNRLGVALFQAGDADAAVGRLSESIRLEPDAADAHNNLGLVLLSTGRHDEALASFHEALRLQPDYALARHNLGKALLAVGRNKEAAAAVSDALRLQASLPGAHFTLGQAYERLGRPDDAVREYRAELAANLAHRGAHEALYRLAP